MSGSERVGGVTCIYDSERSDCVSAPMFASKKHLSHGEGYCGLVVARDNIGAWFSCGHAGGKTAGMAESELVTTSAVPDFWANSGFRLLERDADRHLRVTDEFLRAYLNRPEMAPLDESSPEERVLHAMLVENPRFLVNTDQLARLPDPDARANYRAVLRFRDRLLEGGTLERTYISLFRSGDFDIPPLFVDHLVHALLRNILDCCDDSFRLRAAELLFRAQKVSLVDGAILLADEETVERRADRNNLGTLGRFISEAAADANGVSLDVLRAENAATYWRRSERFDMVLDLTFGRAGLDAFCRALEDWIAHMLGVAVRIEPVRAIRDEHWAWHIGLDREASAILDDLYRGIAVDDERLGRILSLFRLGFAEPAAMRSDLAGRPVYLGIAMTPSRHLRVKPQNLLTNLPLARAA